MDEQKKFDVSEMLAGPKRPFSPLYVIVIVLGVMDFGAFSQIGRTSGWVQASLTIFALGLTAFLVVAFILLLWKRPMNFYSPSEYGKPTGPAELADALQLVRAVSTKEAEKTVDSEGQVAAEQSDSEHRDQLPETLQPSLVREPDWTGWEKVFLEQAVSDDVDLEKMEEAYKHVREEQQDAVTRFRYELTHLLTRFKNGDTSALSKLGALAEEARSVPEKAVDAYLYLGLAYQATGSFQKAEGTYIAALELARNEVERTEATTLLAHARFRLGRREEALEMLKETICATTDSDSLASLYERLAHLYEESGEQELQALALDKALEQKPENTSLRFDTARAYGERDLDALSLLHYKRILQISPRHVVSLNNAGVQYASQDMSIKAAESYKKAYGLGYTLAAANLAYLYLNAGFAEEARRLLEEASKMDDPHPNVARAIASISERREREEETEESLLKSARDQQLFLSAYAQACFSPDGPPGSFAGEWWSEDGHAVIISHQEDALVGTWTANNRVHALKAENQGWTAKITSIRWRSEANEYLSGTIADKGYAYLSPDGQLMYIMGIEGAKVTYMKLSRSIATNRIYPSLSVS